MAASDVLSEMQKISSFLRMASMLPGFAALALEADALDALVANPDKVQKIYDMVESGISVIQAAVTFMRDNGLNEAVHYLTTWGHREAA